MAEFVVVYAPSDPIEPPDDLITRYLERWAKQGRDIRQWTYGDLHVAVGDFGETSTVHESEAGFALLAGKAWHDDNQRATAASIIERGDQSEHRLNGTFAYIHLDSVSDELRVVADRVGNQSIYYAIDGRNIVLSSRHLPIAQAKGFDTAIDEEAIFEHLCFGCCLDDLTLLKNIRTLDLRHELRFRDGEALTHKYWDFVAEELDPSRSVEDVACEYLDLLRASVKRRADSHAVIPVTGGLDSRLLACVAADVLDPDSVSTFTLGDPHRYDVQSGRSISRILGFHHEAIAIPPTFFQDYIHESIERTSGNVIGHTCWRLAADDFLQARRGAQFFGGYWGEFMRLYTDDPDVTDIFDLEATYRFEKVDNKEWFWTKQDQVERMLLPELSAKVDGYIDTKLRTKYLASPAKHPRHHNEYMSATNWWPRRYARMISDHWGAYCDVEFPFNDLPVVEFGFKVPLETKRYGKIFRWLLANKYPRVAAVPYTHTRMPYAAGPLTNFYYRALNAARYKAIPKLTGGRVHWENRAAYVHYRKWLRENNREFVRGVLAETDLYDDILDPSVVKSMFDDVIEGRSDDYGKIYNVATFILWRKKLSERA